MGRATQGESLGPFPPEAMKPRWGAKEPFSLQGRSTSPWRADKGWSGYLVSGVRDLVISAAPPGCIDADTTEWLMSALNRSSPKTGRAIAREILREAPEASQDLRALVMEPRREGSPKAVA